MLEFIGCGSAFNTELGNNGAFIKKDNKLFMIDCGSMTFSRLMKAGVLEGVNEIHVLLTHLHADHVGSLGDLILYSYYSMGKFQEKCLTVYSQYDMCVAALLGDMGVTLDTYDENKFGAGETVSSMGISFNAIPVTHVNELDCYGCFLKIDNEWIYYSGDSNMIPIYALDLLYMGKLDYFYQDTSKADYEGNVHLSLRQLDECIRPEFRHKVYCMHLDKGFDRSEAEALGFNVVEAII